MKKRLLAILFFALLTISFISAIEFDMKEEFSSEEVLIAKLSGDIVKPPIKENIVFYRGHVRIPIDVDIAKIEDDYYLYAALSGKTENNYSIVIEDIEYKKASQTINEDLTKNFTITNKTAPFTIDKGFVVTKDNFYIELENLLDEDLKVDFKITAISGEDGGIAPYEEDLNQEIIINPGKERINFEIDLKKGQAIKSIEFTAEGLTYKIPVSIFVDEFSEQTKLYAFTIRPEKMDLEAPTTGDAIKRLVYIYNTGTGALTNVKVDLIGLEPYVTISEDSFGRIIPGSNANLNLSITPASEKTITGELVVETGQSLINKMSISITFKEGASGEPIIELTTDDTCEYIGGQVCLENEVCKDTTEVIYAKDGICCVAGCQGKTSSSLGKIIGWILVLVLIVAGVWFYFKFKKTKRNPINLLKIAAGKK